MNYQLTKILQRLCVSFGVVAALFFTLSYQAFAITVPEYSEAKVSITFDDGFASTYQNALPVLSQKNIPATLYLTTGFVGTSGYMTWQQVKALQDQHGWEIGSHTLTHPELPLLGLSAIKRELTQSKNKLVAQGLSVTTFATPFGAYDNRVVTEAMKLYDLHRGFWDRDFLNDYPYDNTVIQIQSVEDGVTIDQVKAWIDQAKSEKKWLVLVFHEVLPALDPNYEYTTTISELTEIADYIQQSGVKVVLPKHVAQKPGANLFTNDGFAGGISNGWRTDQPTLVKADTASHGNYPTPTNSIVMTGNTKLSHLYSNSVPVASGSSYLFEGFVNADTLTSGEVTFYVDEYNAQGTWIAGTNLGSMRPDTIAIFSREIKPVASAAATISIQVGLKGGSKGKVYLDTFELFRISQGVVTPSPTPTPSPSVSPSPSASPNATPTPSPSPSASPSATPTPSPTILPSPSPTPSPTAVPAQLIQNASFEIVASGWPSFWTPSSQSVYSLDSTSKGNDGVNSIHITSSTSTQHLFSALFPVAQKSYLWSQYILAPTLTGELGFYIDEYDANSDWISGQWKGALFGPKSGFVTFTYQPSSTSVKKASVQYYLLGGSTIDAYLDSSTLE